MKSTPLTENDKFWILHRLGRLKDEEMTLQERRLKEKVSKNYDGPAVIVNRRYTT